ncbi:hypothetical protein R5R35_007389 [Gryllus longicercus]|uniref:Mediator of RNA polymerase II transcription subunit 16 n=1 Tax=Gryllus longicercus TaxID=2509291 RepID=A0AAN9V4Q8_9ORTH
MDLVYSVLRKHTANNQKSFQNYECLHEGHTLCAVSSKNTVAFTTTTELEDASGKSWGSHVYVADLNTPWHSHKVTSNRAGVTALEWDLPGEKLLLADAAGLVQIWSCREHVLNDWLCLGAATFSGEHILAAAFFHNGKKISVCAEKKDAVFYTEKFTHVRFAPSVRHFGGRPVEGCLVISTTGMVGVAALTQETAPAGALPLTGGSGMAPLLATASDSLGSTRHRIAAADVCYGKNGHFLVAVSSGSASLPIQCYRVSVKQSEEKCVIVSQALPSFFLQSSPAAAEGLYRHVAQLKFVVREDADSLVVASNADPPPGTPTNCTPNSVYGGCYTSSGSSSSSSSVSSSSGGMSVNGNSCNGGAGGLVEIWELREKPLPIHKLFQPKNHTNSVEPYKTVLWQHQSHFVASSPVVCVTTSKLPPPFYVMVALADGTLHCLHRDSLKPVASSSLNLMRQEEPPAAKQQRLSPCVSHLDMSWLGCVLLAADTLGQLHLYRLTPVADPGGGSMTVPHVVRLLEYCLVTGLDCWDLLVCLRPGLVDAVADRFSDGFNRQLAPVQQYHYVHFLNIKTSLYRLTVSGQSKAADLTSLLMLHSVATAFKSLLRPSDLSSHDKGPADSLAAVMTEPLADVDKVLFHLEAKEFTVEHSTLQSLQQLIQWVADLALALLARLPEQRGNSTPATKPSGGCSPASPGYELLRDYKALNTLRELLVVVRIWGLLRQSCLPVFVRSADSLDVLALLFKLLSRLVQAPEPDEALLDDCCLLPNQVMVPTLQPPVRMVAVASPVLFYQSLPIQLEFGTEPDCLHFVPDLSPVEGAMQTEQTLDSIRHIYLGKQPLVVKQCCRCGGKAQLHSVVRTAAIRAWDQRWTRSCRCGGYWHIQRSL